MSLITIIDVTSRLKVESYPCQGTTKPALPDYQLALRYQEEKRTLETDDLTSLIIRGLCHYATNATNNGGSPHWAIKTTQVKEIVRDLVEEEDIKTDFITNDRIGCKLGTMRLDNVARIGKEGGKLEKHARRSGKVGDILILKLPYPPT